MEQQLSHADEHRDDAASKLGMWIFIFTELLLFGGLFLVYAVYRAQYHEQFHQAGLELNVTIGVVNTVILLISSMTVAISLSAMQQKDKTLSMQMLAVTMLMGLIFLVNKYFEWAAKIHHGIYPGSPLMVKLEHGHLLYFSLYYFMTGLHALHIIVGMIILLIVFFRIKSGRTHPARYMFLENGALYWHLVDLIWIFLFPLLYLIT
jgi:cytochrome c oxidase subunit III